MSQFEEWLQALIRERGAISFRDFMYWALYHPDFGYYTSKQRVFGTTGDFYTAPGVHAVFGETVGKDIIKRYEQLGKPESFAIVEYGAGKGKLAKDILQTIKQLDSELYQRLDYWIIEVSGNLREAQRKILAQEPVQWAQDAAEIGPFSGIVLSNELIDAFPVHVLVKQASELQEMYVTVKDRSFVETWGPVSDERIPLYVQTYYPMVLDNQWMEVNLDAIDWLRKATSNLQAGFLITIDYGDEARFLYEEKSLGTIRAFHEHQIKENLLDLPGEQDLTADVNFTALIQSGETLGLEKIYFGSQARYLMEAGILAALATPQLQTDPFHDDAIKRNLAIKHLIMPTGMGERFKVLVQRKSKV